ncbi:MAG: hypothetical protein JSV04_13305 [Candidatus Heimdallarchaeota archaeon]|nr:MAG: hypothetical protein JSV04_13305 [Candidatus Heimdallarchaeota archaeon]
MPSQYITYMIIFTLGLSMVIITNNMFQTISDQFRLNVAEIELTQILELIQMQIQQTMLFYSDSNQTIEQQFELPPQIGQRYKYSIEITNSTRNQIILYGVSSNNDIYKSVSFSLGEKYIIRITDSSFESTNLILKLLIEKNVNEITITIS